MGPITEDTVVDNDGLFGLLGAIHTEDMQEHEKDLVESKLAQLTDILQMLKASCDPSIHYTYFSTNLEFLDRFGYDPDEWVPNIEAYLEQYTKLGYGLGLEGMKTQDVLSWTIIGLPISIYKSSFKRMRRRLERVKKETHFMADSTPSVYLLKYSDFIKKADAINGLQAILTGYAKGTDMLKVDDVLKGAKSIGIDLKEYGDSTNWKAVIHKIIRTFGYVTKSDSLKERGKDEANTPVRKYGWDMGKLHNQAIWWLEALENHEKISELFDDAKEFKVASFTMDDLDEHKRAMRMVRSIYKGYASALRKMGRGLSSVDQVKKD